MGEGPALDINWWNGLREMIFVSFCPLQDRVVGTLGFTRRVGLDIQSIIFSVGRAIIGFWVLLRSCLKMRLGNLGRHVRITTRWRFVWHIALLQGPLVDCVGLIWVALRGSSDGAVLARAALATELDRRVTEDEPTTWTEVVLLGVGIARAVLGEEPVQDHRPWVKGLEHELSTYDQAVSGAHTRNRQADSWEELRESVAEIRRCKRPIGLA